jgi:hypothetical protein
MKLVLSVLVHYLPFVDAMWLSACCNRATRPADIFYFNSFTTVTLLLIGRGMKYSDTSTAQKKKECMKFETWVKLSFFGQPQYCEKLRIECTMEAWIHVLSVLNVVIAG